MEKFSKIVKHILGLRTVAPIGVSAFGGYIALADRQMTVYNPDFWLLLAGGLGLGLVSWIAIAVDSYKKEEERRDLSLKLDGVLSRVSEEEFARPNKLSSENLSGMTNQEIKRAVAIL